MAKKQESQASDRDQQRSSTSKGDQAVAKGETSTERGTASQAKADHAELQTPAGAEDSQKIQSLIEQLSGDLGGLDLDAAAAEIDQWYGVLHQSKGESYKAMANSLKQLKQLLKGGKGTGHEVGDVLIQLGEQTEQVSGEANQGLKTPIHKLGKQLEKVGASLAKAEDQQQIDQINTAIELLDGDLGDVDVAAALGLVDQWYAALHKSEDEHQKQIAACLKELKPFLKGTKKVAPVEALRQLGELTSAAAGEASRGYKGPLQKLGKALSKVADSLE